MVPTNKPDIAYRSWENAGHKTAMRLDPQGRTAGPMPFVGFMNHGTGINTQELGQTQKSYLTNSMNIDEGPKPDIKYDTQNDDNFSFGDIIDIINPLQHLPIIGMIYRNLTHDVMRPMSSIIGGTLFGGPIGAVASTVNVVVKDRTGMDLAENALSIGGFNIAPQQTQKPEITFDTSKAISEDAKQANSKNFASTRPQNLYWNA